jgi:hypothetical protein
MPYGGEGQDHELLSNIDLKPYLFKKKPGKIQMIYAGAMLPKAYERLEAIFKSIAGFKQMFEKFEFYFIGTGKTPDDPQGHNIKPLAEKYGLWQTNVYEYPKRISYLVVLVHLKEADGVFILGSTEPHYTPSKTYQAVLSGKPILAVLHKESTAVKVLRESGAGIVLDFDGEEDVVSVEKKFPSYLRTYTEFLSRFNPDLINKKLFDQYSASAVTKELATLLDKSIPALSPIVELS